MFLYLFTYSVIPQPFQFLTTDQEGVRPLEQVLLNAEIIMEKVKEAMGRK